MWGVNYINIKKLQGIVSLFYLRRLLNSVLCIYFFHTCCQANNIYHLNWATGPELLLYPELGGLGTTNYTPLHMCTAQAKIPKLKKPG